MRSVGAAGRAGPGDRHRPGRCSAPASVPRRWPRVFRAQLPHRWAWERSHDDPECADGFAMPSRCRQECLPTQRAAWHHLLAALAFGVLAAANVLAFFPALLAAQPRPAQLLRPSDGHPPTGTAAATAALTRGDRVLIMSRTRLTTARGQGPELAVLCRSVVRVSHRPPTRIRRSV